MHAPNPTSRRIDRPEPGYFRMRLVKRGWEIPCQIIRHIDGSWEAIMDGTPRGADTDPTAAPWVARIWEGGKAIDEAEYRWRLEMRAWAEANDPRHPALHPAKPINGLTITPLIPVRTPR